MSKLTVEQALEILQQAILETENAGVTIHVTPYFQQGQTSVIVVLANVELIAGKLMATADSAGNTVASNAGNTPETAGNIEGQPPAPLAL